MWRWLIWSLRRRLRGAAWPILLCSKCPARSPLHKVLLLLQHLTHARGLVLFYVVDEFPFLVFLLIVDHVDSHALRRASYSSEAGTSTLQTKA